MAKKTPIDEAAENYVELMKETTLPATKSVWESDIDRDFRHGWQAAMNQKRRKSQPDNGGER